MGLGGGGGGGGGGDSFCEVTGFSHVQHKHSRECSAAVWLSQKSAQGVFFFFMLIR